MGPRPTQRLLRRWTSWPWTPSRSATTRRRRTTTTCTKPPLSSTWKPSRLQKSPTNTNDSSMDPSLGITALIDYLLFRKRLFTLCLFKYLTAPGSTSKVSFYFYPIVYSYMNLQLAGSQFFPTTLYPSFWDQTRALSLNKQLFKPRERGSMGLKFIFLVCPGVMEHCNSNFFNIMITVSSFGWINWDIISQDLNPILLVQFR